MPCYNIVSSIIPVLAFWPFVVDIQGFIGSLFSTHRANIILAFFNLLLPIVLMAFRQVLTSFLVSSFSLWVEWLCFADNAYKRKSSRSYCLSERQLCAYTPRKLRISFKASSL